MINTRTHIEGTNLDILGTFEELDEKLHKGEITREEYDEFFSNSRLHGLCGDIHPFALGGSDSAGVIGCSPWKAPSDVMKEKTGIKSGDDDDKKYIFGRGHIYEPSIREAFSLITGLKTQVFPYQVVNSNWPHCVANIDGIVWDGDSPGILEIKSTDFGSSAYRSFFELNEVPEYYYTQIQFYMMVLGYEYAYIVCAKDFSERGMKYFKVLRDEDYGNELMDSMENFVYRVSKGLKIDDSIVSNEKLIKKKLREICGDGDRNKSIALPLSLADTLITYDSYLKEQADIMDEIRVKKSEADKLGRQMNKLKERIALEMKDATSGTLSCSEGKWDVKFDPVDPDKLGSGHERYLKTYYPEVFEDTFKQCPPSRKMSIRRIQDDDN